MTAALWAAAAAAALMLAVLCLLCVALRRQKRENKELRKALSDCQARFRTLDESLNALRELRHDLRHYLQASDAPIPAGTEDLLHAPQTSGDIISELLERYRLQAEASGAETDIRLEMTPIPDDMLPDLYLILSNLLENAVEALSREGGGRLRVRSIAAPGYLSLVAGNSCSTELKAVGGQYLSSKSPGRLGLGLQTVRRIARQYGGDAVFNADGKEFHACVFLSVPEAPAETDPTPQEKQ